MDNAGKSKIIAAIVSILVLVLLILIGPANAFILGLTVSDNTPNLGDIIDFMLTAEIEDEDVILNIDFFTLKFQGPTDIECRFFPNGTKIDACPGLTITQIESSNFGYGYGYGYGYLPGFFKFNLTLNTSVLSEGDYDVVLLTSIDGEQSEEQAEEEITINDEEPQDLVDVCSLRGDDGESFIDEELFSTKNKVNLHYSRGSNGPGQGFFTSQAKKDRISFKYNVSNVFREGNNVIIEVTGMFRLNRDDEIPLDATLTLDKETETLKVESNEFDAFDLDAQILKGC